MSVMLARNFGKEVADILGLKDTREIVIRMRYDNFVELEVEALVRSDEGKSLLDKLRHSKYLLVLLSEEDSDFPDISEKWPGLEIVETTTTGDAHRTYGVRVKEPA